MLAVRRPMLRRVALVLFAASLLPSCDAIRDWWEMSHRLSERCHPGIEEEVGQPLTDAKISSTLKMWDAWIAAKATTKTLDRKADELMVELLEAGGLGCGQQVAVMGKMRKAIDRVRERRGLPPLAGADDASDPDESRAAKSLTDADVALVEARFDEVNAALERFIAAG